MNKIFLIIKILSINIFHHHTDIFLFQPHEKKSHRRQIKKNFTPANAFFCTALRTILFAETKTSAHVPAKKLCALWGFPRGITQLFKKNCFFL